MLGKNWAKSGLLALALGLSSLSLTLQAKPVDFSDADYSGNIWAVFQSDFDIPEAVQNQPSVQKQIHWFMTHQDYLVGSAIHSKPYLYYVYQQVRARDLPSTITLLPFIESEYNPCVYSGAGAAGLWQMMPHTATGFGIKQDFWYDGRRDIISSTKAALDYLSYLDNYFGGDWLLALASYDAGEGTVQAAIHKNRAEGRPTDFWALDLPEETEIYVPRLVALAIIISHPEKYPLHLPRIKAAPYLAEVDIGKPIDMAHAAQLAEVDLRELYRLNPGYKRGSTDPNGPYRLLLPIDKVDTFENNLSKQAHTHLTSHQYYVVKPGDTLGGIANKYNTTVHALGSANKLATKEIRPGEKLVIPAEDERILKFPGTANDYCMGYTQNDANSTYDLLTYNIRLNDTLASIAATFKVSEKDLEKWNKITANTPLMPGQVLRIYTATPLQ